METAGYIASVLIGISLGLIGSGGSILTVPVLVYLFGIDAVLATTYSLFIVGATSVVGSVAYFKKRMVNVKTAIVFGIPSIGAIYLTRTYIVPAIPQVIFNMGSLAVTKNIALMVLFAVLMIFASYSMIKKDKHPADPAPGKQQLNHLLLFAQGIFIGVITGLVGAGGGFLIIPALVNLLKMPIKTAVGTSLVVIAINSSMGFLFSLPHTSIQWNFLASIAFIAMVGILVGSYISTKIDGKKLKPSFGWFVLVMGSFIIIKEALLK